MLPRSVLVVAVVHQRNGAVVLLFVALERGAGPWTPAGGKGSRSCGCARRYRAARRIEHLDETIPWPWGTCPDAAARGRPRSPAMACVSGLVARGRYDGSRRACGGMSFGQVREETVFACAMGVLGSGPRPQNKASGKEMKRLGGSPGFIRTSGCRVNSLIVVRPERASVLQQLSGWRAGEGASGRTGRVGD